MFTRFSAPMGKLFFVLFQAAIINNFVLTRFLGATTAMAFAGTLTEAIHMGLSVTGVLVTASLLTWLVNALVLVPLGAHFLSLLFFMIIIVALLQIVEVKHRGAYGLLLLTNCVVLGGTVLNIQNQFSFMESLFASIGGGLGFLMVLILLTSLRERLSHADIPRVFRGVPILLITAGILSLSLTVFSAFSVH